VNAHVGAAEMKMNRINWKKVALDVLIIWSVTFVGSALALGIRRIPYVLDHWLPVKTALEAIWTLVGFTVAGCIGARTKSKRMQSLSVAGAVVWLFGLIKLLIFPAKMVGLWLLAQAVVVTV